MGIAQLPALQAGLLQALPGRTPAAAVQHATLPQQRQVVATLATLPAAVAEAGLGSPAVLIVGDVLLGLARAGESLGEGHRLTA
jgi:uroporphyrin-III C-methyltransferase